jgi:hypothetical protein
MSFSQQRGSQRKKRGSSVLSFNPAEFSHLVSAAPTAEKGGEIKTAISAMQGDTQMDFDSVNRKLLLELQASTSPELSFGDTVEHMVRLTREFFGVDRVGFFIVDKERGLLFLKVTQEGAGLRIPLKGIAGHIARSGQTVNIEDAYLDERFDPTMVSFNRGASTSVADLLHAHKGFNMSGACMLIRSFTHSRCLLLAVSGHEHWVSHEANAVCASVRLPGQCGWRAPTHQHRERHFVPGR